ncbi:hypothetical protein [Sphingobium lactosutens]|nr:hypothetical protein [Sphingobium lactosutens]
MAKSIAGVQPKIGSVDESHDGPVDSPRIETHLRHECNIISFWIDDDFL